MSEYFFDKIEDDFITFEELKTLLLRMLPSESDSLELAKYYYENIAEDWGVNRIVEQSDNDDTRDLVEILDLYDLETIAEEDKQ
jgi:hypothetical protein